MIHQGALVLSDNARKIKMETIASGNFSEIVHLHLKNDHRMDEHIFNNKSTMIVISGEMDVVTNGHRYKLEKGDFAHFEEKTPYTLEAFEDTHAIIVR